MNAQFHGYRLSNTKIPDGSVVMALFRFDSIDDEPCVVRCYSNGWTNLTGIPLSVAPERWRPLSDEERSELMRLFPTNEWDWF